MTLKKNILIKTLILKFIVIDTKATVQEIDNKNFVL